MVNRYKLKLTLLQQEILKYLMINAGESINARRLAIELEVSPPAISKAIPLLQRGGFIKVEKDSDSGRFSISFNREEQKMMQLKRAENLKMLYECGVVEYLEQTFPGCDIILFGSYSRGDDIFNSDIDIAIIGSKSKREDLERFEKILGKEIIINYYGALNEINKNLKENILNGITLVGSLRL